MRDRLANRQTGRHTEMVVGRGMLREAGREREGRERVSERQTGKQTDRQAHRDGGGEGV